MKVTGIQCWFLTLPPTCTDSLNLLVILRTVDDEIPQFLAIVHLETLFLNCKNICSHSCSQPRPILACERLSLSGMLLLYPIMALSQSFVAPIPAILERVAHIQFKMRVYLQKNNKMYQFEH